MPIVGPQGPPGGGLVLSFTAGRFTSTLAPAQATNWLASWGLASNPQLTREPEWSIYAPFAGTLSALRVTRAVTAADLTFDVEINGVSVATLLLPGGSGAADTSNLAFTQAIAKSGLISVAITAATPDSAAAGIVSASMLLLP
jgi:hypothetical protein